MKPGIVRVTASPLEVAKLAAVLEIPLPVTSEREALFAAVYEDDEWSAYYARANAKAGNVRVVGRGNVDGLPAVIAVAIAKEW